MALRTSSRTHFEVLGLKGQFLGLDLEACKSSKMPCPRSRTALFFDLSKMDQDHNLCFFALKNAKDLAENLWRLFFGERLLFRGKFATFLREDLFFGGQHLRIVSLAQSIPVLASRGSVLGKTVLGLGHGFFCMLRLEPCVLDSSSDSHITLQYRCCSSFNAGFRCS